MIYKQLTLFHANFQDSVFVSMKSKSITKTFLLLINPPPPPLQYTFIFKSVNCCEAPKEAGRSLVKVSLALSPRVYVHKHTEHRRNEREQREWARQQPPLLALLSQIINTVYTYFKASLSTAPLRGYRTHSNTSSLPKLIKKTDTAAEDPHFSVCAVIAQHRLVNNNRERGSESGWAEARR